MILTQHGKNSRRLPACIIGGRQYKVVKIGDQFWMAENLDFKFPGCSIGATGTPSTPAAWYYDNDEALYGIDGTYRLGLLYNWHAVEYIETNKASLCPGWHVPTEVDWGDLITAIGANPATAMKAVDNSVFTGFPTGWNGTDTTGLDILPGGRYSGSFGLLNTDGRYWTSTETSPTAAADRRFSSAATVAGNTNYKYVGYSVRLVRD